MLSILIRGLAIGLVAGLYAVIMWRKIDHRAEYKPSVRIRKRYD